MRIFRAVAVYLVLAAVTACGSSTPTAPSPKSQVPSPPPSILGQWSGGYTTRSCQEMGAAVGSGFCQFVGIGGGLVLTPQQTGSAVSGTLSIGGLSPIPITGSLGTDAVLALQGSGPIQFDATLALVSFRGILSGQQINGTLSYTVSTPAPNLGSAVVTADFTLLK